MAHLSLEAKEAILTKALSRGDTPLVQVARECGVGYTTLQTWLRLKREGHAHDRRQQHGRPSKGHGQTSPLQHILSTAGLDEKSVGAYCREQGIHSFQLNQWQDELMAHTGGEKHSKDSSKEIKALRDEVKKLKQDLRRKDKALAETSALLVLKKKANLIWGEFEDD